MDPSLIAYVFNSSFANLDAWVAALRREGAVALGKTRPLGIPKVVEKVNAVARGTASYFATAFSGCQHLFCTLDKRLRMRIRSMKFKGKRATDNWRLWRKHFRNLGFELLWDALVSPAVEPT